MPTNVNESTSGTTNTNSNDTNSDSKIYREWMDEGAGTDAEGTEGTTDGTADNVYENDPEKNKKLAEITMAEQLRETYQLTIKIPNILTGLHTNQFFFIELNDQFYEKNYPEIIKAIANKKFAQYAGFEKGRFFIDKVTEKGGMDGWGMEIKLNPIPPSLATYSRMQMEATKALIQAINDESNGSVSYGSANFSSLDEIYAEAATFTYGGAGTDLSPEKAWEYYEGGGRTFDCYDCSNWLFYCIRGKGMPCRIIQGGGTGASGTHRVVQVQNGTTWECPPQAWNLTERLRPFRPPEKHGATPMLTFDGTNTFQGDGSSGTSNTT